MAIKYEWTVVQMDCYSQVGTSTDVVFDVHWTLTGTDGSYASSIYGLQRVTLDPKAPFTSYADLTEAKVVGWVQGGLGAEQVAGYEEAVAQQLGALANPPVVTPPLPWAA